jgi:hypothetical protein
MPDLKQSLLVQDLGYLRIVAELWGLDLNFTDARSEADLLVPLLLDRSLLEEVIESLPAEAEAALQTLLHNEGRLQWAVFIRRFGEVREMGAGRRDRERPFEDPISPAETLWYRALVGRAFFDTPDGPQEFAYIPTDLIPLLPEDQVKRQISFGNPASPEELGKPIPADDHILDHACTLLAALRIGLPLEQLTINSHPSSIQSPYPLSAQPLHQLLIAAGLVSVDDQPESEETRTFLEASRGEGLVKLAQAWLQSDQFNELSLIPGLQLEGEWANDPRKTRMTIMGFLSSIPPGKWWSMSAFIASVHQHHPDFQRPAGDYDSWFIRKRETGEYLRGFVHWDQVDGALLHYLIAGPMHWLGMMELIVQPDNSSNVGVLLTAFRLSSWSVTLLNGGVLTGLPKEEATILVHSDGRIRVPRYAPRVARYQIARFCAWENEEADTYQYKLTPSSLARARKQGLSSSHLVALLRRYTPATPPNLVKALEKWEEHGTQARLERLLVLRLKSPDVLQELRASRAARFLGDRLGPTAVIVKFGAWEKVVAVLAELGYLTEMEDHP